MASRKKEIPVLKKDSAKLNAVLEDIFKDLDRNHRQRAGSVPPLPTHIGGAEESPPLPQQQPKKQQQLKFRGKQKATSAGAGARARGGSNTSSVSTMSLAARLNATAKSLTPEPRMLDQPPPPHKAKALPPLAGNKRAKTIQGPPADASLPEDPEVCTHGPNRTHSLFCVMCSNREVELRAGLFQKTEQREDKERQRIRLLELNTFTGLRDDCFVSLANERRILRDQRRKAEQSINKVLVAQGQIDREKLFNEDRLGRRHVLCDWEVGFDEIAAQMKLTLRLEQQIRDMREKSAARKIQLESEAAAAEEAALQARYESVTSRARQLIETEEDTQRTHIQNCHSTGHMTMFDIFSSNRSAVLQHENRVHNMLARHRVYVQAIAQEIEKMFADEEIMRERTENYERKNWESAVHWEPSQRKLAGQICAQRLNREKVDRQTVEDEETEMRSGHLDEAKELWQQLQDDSATQLDLVMKHDARRTVIQGRQAMRQDKERKEVDIMFDVENMSWNAVRYDFEQNLHYPSVAAEAIERKELVLMKLKNAGRIQDNVRARVRMCQAQTRQHSEIIREEKRAIASMLATLVRAERYFGEEGGSLSSPGGQQQQSENGTPRHSSEAGSENRFLTLPGQSRPQSATGSVADTEPEKPKFLRGDLALNIHAAECHARQVIIADFMEASEGEWMTMRKTSHGLAFMLSEYPILKKKLHPKATSAAAVTAASMPGFGSPMAAGRESVAAFNFIYMHVEGVPMEDFAAQLEDVPRGPEKNLNNVSSDTAEPTQDDNNGNPQLLLVNKMAPHMWFHGSQPLVLLKGSALLDYDLATKLANGPPSAQASPTMSMSGNPSPLGKKGTGWGALQNSVMKQENSLGNNLLTVPTGSFNPMSMSALSAMSTLGANVMTTESGLAAVDEEAVITATILNPQLGDTLEIANQADEPSSIIGNRRPSDVANVDAETERPTSYEVVVTLKRGDPVRMLLDNLVFSSTAPTFSRVQQYARGIKVTIKPTLHAVEHTSYLAVQVLPPLFVPPTTYLMTGSSFPLFKGGYQPPHHTKFKTGKVRVELPSNATSRLEWICPDEFHSNPRQGVLGRDGKVILRPITNQITNSTFEAEFDLLSSNVNGVRNVLNGVILRRCDNDGPHEAVTATFTLTVKDGDYRVQSTVKLPADVIASFPPRLRMPTLDIGMRTYSQDVPARLQKHVPTSFKYLFPAATAMFPDEHQDVIGGGIKVSVPDGQGKFALAVKTWGTWNRYVLRNVVPTEPPLGPNALVGGSTWVVGGSTDEMLPSNAELWLVAAPDPDGKELMGEHVANVTGLYTCRLAINFLLTASLSPDQINVLLHSLNVSPSRTLGYRGVKPFQIKLALDLNVEDSGDTIQADFKMTLHPPIADAPNKNYGLSYLEGSGQKSLPTMDPKVSTIKLGPEATIQVEFLNGYEMWDTLDVLDKEWDEEENLYVFKHKGQPIAWWPKNNTDFMNSGNTPESSTRDDSTPRTRQSVAIPALADPADATLKIHVSGELGIKDWMKVNITDPYSPEAQALITDYQNPFQEIPISGLGVLLHSLTYETSSPCPAILKKTLLLTLDDGRTGRTRLPVEISIEAVDDPTELILVSDDLTYRQQCPETVKYGFPLFPGSGLYDPDSDNFHGGFALIEQANPGESPGDTLTLLNEFEQEYHIHQKESNLTSTTALQFVMETAVTPQSIQATTTQAKTGGKQLSNDTFAGGQVFSNNSFGTEALGATRLNSNLRPGSGGAQVRSFRSTNPAPREVFRPVHVLTLPFLDLLVSEQPKQVLVISDEAPTSKSGESVKGMYFAGERIGQVILKAPKGAAAAGAAAAGEGALYSSLKFCFSSAGRFVGFPIVEHCLKCVGFENTSSKMKEGVRTFNIRLNGTGTKATTETNETISVTTQLSIMSTPTTKVRYEEGGKPVKLLKLASTCLNRTLSHAGFIKATVVIPPPRHHTNTTQPISLPSVSTTNAPAGWPTYGSDSVQLVDPSDELLFESTNEIKVKERSLFFGKDLVAVVQRREPGNPTATAEINVAFGKVTGTSLQAVLRALCYVHKNSKMEYTEDRVIEITCSPGTEEESHMLVPIVSIVNPKNNPAEWVSGSLRVQSLHLAKTPTPILRALALKDQDSRLYTEGTTLSATIRQRLQGCYLTLSNTESVQLQYQSGTSGWLDLVATANCAAAPEGTVVASVSSGAATHSPSGFVVFSTTINLILAGPNICNRKLVSLLMECVGFANLSGALTEPHRCGGVLKRSVAISFKPKGCPAIVTSVEVEGAPQLLDLGGLLSYVRPKAGVRSRTAAGDGMGGLDASDEDDDTSLLSQTVTTLSHNKYGGGGPGGGGTPTLIIPPNLSMAIFSSVKIPPLIALEARFLELSVKMVPPPQVQTATRPVVGSAVAMAEEQQLSTDDPGGDNVCVINFAASLAPVLGETEFRSFNHEAGFDMFSVIPQSVRKSVVTKFELPEGSGLLMGSDGSTVNYNSEKKKSPLAKVTVHELGGVQEPPTEAEFEAGIAAGAVTLITVRCEAVPPNPASLQTLLASIQVMFDPPKPQRKSASTSRNIEDPASPLVDEDDEHPWIALCAQCHYGETVHLMQLGSA